MEPRKQALHWIVLTCEKLLKLDLAFLWTLWAFPLLLFERRCNPGNGADALDYRLSAEGYFEGSRLAYKGLSFGSQPSRLKLQYEQRAKSSLSGVGQ